MGVQENIRRYREENGMSQRELAQRIGVTQSAVGNIEAGLKVPSLAVITSMAEVLGTTIDQLVGR